MSFARGEIWLAGLSATVGIEQAGTRPVVIIFRTRHARMPIHQVIVVPVTSRDRQLPHHIRVRDDGGLKRPSWAMTEALRAISSERLVHRIGRADGGTFDLVLDNVHEWFRE